MNEELYDAALEAITKLYLNTNVSKEDVIDSMRDLQSEINAMIDALD